MAGTVSLTTRFACFVATVLLATGPALWLLGTINGDEVSVDGGGIRVVAQLALAAICAQVARTPRPVSRA